MKSKKGEIGFDEIVRIIIVIAILVVLLLLSFVFKEKIFELADQAKEFLRFV
jgi:hypothetical protein